MMLKFLGIVYGVFSITSLLTFWYFLRYGPSFPTLDSGNLQYHFGILGICMVNALVGALIFYSFWSSMAWGRYLAIGFNVVWVGTAAVGFLVGRMTDGALPLLTGSVMFFIGVFFVVPLAITIFLLRYDMKKLSDPLD